MGISSEVPAGTAPVTVVPVHHAFPGRRSRNDLGPRPGSPRVGRLAAMDLGLQDRRAAIAGASSGLGLATARALAAEGVRVAICGRDRERIEQAAASIGGDVVALVADMATTDGPGAFIEQAVAALGGVDILVANAGG